MMMVVMAMGQRSHYKQMLGDRGASVNRFLSSRVGVALRIPRDGYPATVAADKCLIPQGKHVPVNRRSIFVMLSIKNIHPSRYVSSLTVTESAA
jgi:hypothetical protein